MKKINIIGMILMFFIGNLVVGSDRKDTSTDASKNQFQIEAEQLKLDYADLEKQISKYYEEEFKRLKEQKYAELEQLHREMNTRYVELQKKYGIEKSLQKDDQKNRETLKKNTNKKSVKDPPKRTRSVKQKKK